MPRYASLLSLVALAGCAGAVPLYPPRPSDAPTAPVADPTPARVVVHATVTSAALRGALEEAVPLTGDGTFPLLGKERRYAWRREPVSLRFDQGRIGVGLRISTKADLPVGHVDLPIEVRVLAEPVVGSNYVARLQSTRVEVVSDDRLVRLADSIGGLLEKVKGEVQARVDDFSYELRPLVAEAHERLARPLPLPLEGASGCASLQLLGVEAGPTVLADGIEKDLALVVAPSVTLPCADAGKTFALPPLSNVAAVPAGPFTVTVPVAASYPELGRAMGQAFTNGKLFFSKEYPGLYLERPEVFASQDRLVLKLHVAGPVKKMFVSTDIDGDLYLTGHPTVEDNELRVPDLEPTIETSNLLLRLKADLDGRGIRDQARAALRLDIGERVRSVRDKLASDLSFGGGKGCFRAEAHKIEVTGVHAHANYLRVYVTVTARAAVDMPCPTVMAPPG
jgi:uncharacterized protein DUF4403